VQVVAADAAAADATAFDAASPVAIVSLFSSIGRSEDTFCALDSRRRGFCWNDFHWSNRISTAVLSASAVDFPNGRPVVVRPTGVEFVAWHLGLSPGDVASQTLSATSAGLRDVAGAFEHEGSIAVWASDGTWSLLNLGSSYSYDSLSDARSRAGRVRISRDLSQVRVSSMVMSELDVCAIVGQGVQCWPRADASGPHRRGLRASRHSVRLPAPAEQLAASDATFCARTRAGVFCWGDGAAGSLGNGRCDSSPTPVSVLGLPGTVELVGRREYFCAIDERRQVWCWGALGCSTTSGARWGCPSERATPSVDERLGRARSVAIGCFETCAVQVDGSLRCAGGYRPRSQFERAGEVLTARVSD
jgi:hypothetical protein